MTLDEMQKAISGAKATLRSVDGIANDLAYLLEGRLRHVHSWTLKRLKKELRNFNMHTGSWSE